ncbi:MAG: acyl-CoA dehydrogenase [Candidatus Binatia bacterium]|nr:MAG: acyl-CoA dehydrogenase [Candidatus Binatia bacterium]
MIDLRLGPEEEMIRETGQAFARERLRPAMREHERRGSVAAEVVRAYRELGFPTMEAPESFGGQGVSLLSKVVLLEEIGWGDAGAAFALEGAGPGLRALVELGERDLCGDLLADPACYLATIVDFAGRIAVREGRLEGRFPFVPASPKGPVVVLLPEGIFLCREGVRVSRVEGCGLGASGASEVSFDGTPAAATCRDPAALVRSVAHARLFVAALLVGVARAATEYAMRYAQERVAFGRPIAHHQGLAFLLTDMATAVDAARLLLWRAAFAPEAELERLSAWALAEAAEAALFVGPNAVQVLGGHGFMKDHPVEKWMRDIRTLAQLAGGRDEAELVAAECEAR